MSYVVTHEFDNFQLLLRHIIFTMVVTSIPGERYLLYLK